MTVADLVIWSPQETLTININADPEFWLNVLTSYVYFFMHLEAPDRSTRTNLSCREKFLQEHICHKCKQVLPKAENMTSNEDASIMCEFSCNCSMWFHWQGGEASK